MTNYDIWENTGRYIKEFVIENIIPSANSSIALSVPYNNLDAYQYTITIELDLALLKDNPMNFGSRWEISFSGTAFGYSNLQNQNYPGNSINYDSGFYIINRWEKLIIEHLQFFSINNGCILGEMEYSFDLPELTNLRKTLSFKLKLNPMLVYFDSLDHVVDADTCRNTLMKQFNLPAAAFSHPSFDQQRLSIYFNDAT